MWQVVALSFGLAMDATAVSAARGLGGEHRRELAILPLVFGAFQSGMSALGWLGGEWAGEYIAGWYRWVAFGLLGLIGLKMIVDGWRGDGDTEHVKATPVVYLALGVATSIDASVAGLTLPILPVSPWLSVLVIGVITAGCSALGFLGGRAIGSKLGSRLSILGGIVLIGIGVSMLR
jgi:putative Mn2+ efflux pump MntP